MALMIQLGATMSVNQTVESAADEGAREAAKAAATATTDQQIVTAAVDAVNEVLSIHSLEVSPDVGSGVRVIVNHNPTGTALVSLGEAGDPNITSKSAFPDPLQGEIQVIVIVHFETGSPNADPVPNLLNTFGVDLSDKQFEVSATAKKE